jgi:hypothetical protein
MYLVVLSMYVNSNNAANHIMALPHNSPRHTLRGSVKVDIRGLLRVIRAPDLGAPRHFPQRFVQVLVQVRPPQPLPLSRSAGQKRPCWMRTYLVCLYIESFLIQVTNTTCQHFY